jgi:NAD(P)-dependent dehydrogenase (short-subunit alcohol dehydrogenase family)
VWAAELAPRAIRVNTIVPGPTDTPALRGLVPDEASVAALLQQLADSTPMARVANPAEIASAVLFLAKSEFSYMTRSELFADGGEVQPYR